MHRHKYRVAVGAAVALLVVAPCGAITIQEDNGPSLRTGGTDPGSAGAPAPQVKQENGITYISGGRGTEERDALEATGRTYNLKLTVAAPGGEYVVPDTLRIANQQGKTLLEARPDGPLFFAKLPAGAYSVTVVTGGKEQTRAVTVSSQGQEAIAMSITPPEGPPSRAGDAPAPPNVAAPNSADQPVDQGGAGAAPRSGAE